MPEVKDKVKIEATTTPEVKTLKTHPDLSAWTQPEKNKRLIQLTEESISKWQPLVDKAKRNYEKVARELNEAVDLGNPEEAAKLTFEAAEKKKILNDLKQSWKAGTDEKLIIEKHYRMTGDEKFNTPSVFIANRNMTRVS